MSLINLTGMWSGVNDQRIYRTQLDQESGGWRLSVDGVRVAETDGSLTASDAQDWACRSLGEGVAFLPGDEHGSYWVANPEQGAVR